MKYTQVLTIFSFLFLITSCKENTSTQKVVNQKFEGIPVIRLDNSAISGIGLKPVKNKNQPDRRLFQKRLIRGNDLSVYVVSSETATAQQENYAMEEFICLTNGQSRMNPTNGKEVIFDKGDSFIAPKGFTGEWETIGGDEFLIELSIITTKRIDGQVDPDKTLPYLIDKRKRSGVGISQIEDGSYLDILYEGIELKVTVEGHETGIVNHNTPMQEQVIEVLSGKVSITPKDGSTDDFLVGDYFMIPEDFMGSFEYVGHGVVRTMHVYKER